MYTPNRPRSPFFSPYQPPIGLSAIAAPRLDRPLGRRLLLVGAAERHPVALRLQQAWRSSIARACVHQLRPADLADDRRRVGRVVALHLVLATCPGGVFRTHGSSFVPLPVAISCLPASRNRSATVTNR